MVEGHELPKISWEEDFGPEDERRIAERIVVALTGDMASVPPGCSRLFFFVPTPAPYATAEAQLLRLLNAAGIGIGNMKVLALPRGGRCYVVSGEECLRVLIPHAFHLGPPELTFVAANCRFDIGAAEEELANFAIAVLEGNFSEGRQDIVGMHFDSGDLVELF